MIKSGKYLQAPSELAVEISKVFETKPTRKQVADYMSDKFGTDKNKPSSGDFIDTLDSVMNDIDFYYSDDGEIESSRQIKSSHFEDTLKKQIESKLNFDKITDMCDDLDFSTLGYGHDPHGDMIAELDAIEGESGNIEDVEIRFTENDDGQTVIAVYKKDHKVDTMTTKLVDGEISRDDINEAVYDFLEENSQMLNSSRKPIKSAKYDSDTSNLRAMKIPEDLPMWIFEKYVDETNQHNKEWVWYYFLEAIKHNPWKSGFTGDSLYATDGNIDIVVGPQQARCRLYKVTPKSQSMTELPYAAGGKKDDFYDWYIDKRYIDAFIKDVLHNYIWSRIKSSRKPIKFSIKSALSRDEIFKQIEFYEQQIEYTKNLLNGEYNDVGRNERKLLERRLKDFKDGLARLNELLNDEKDNLYKKVEFTPKEMKAIREEAKRINYKPGMENSLILALKKRNDGTAGSLYFKNREIWNKSGMAKDTDYGFDLIKKKIKSMNGNFDVDDDNDDVFQSRKAIKSAFSLSESERDGLSLVIGYITGIYGDDEDVAKYEAVRNSLSEDELKELENLLRYVIDAKQDVKVVKEANLKKDIPLLNKVYGILDENDLLDDSDAWYGFKKLESSRRPVKSERDKTFWNISNGYLTGNEVMKIMNEIDDWCAHRALTHSDIRGYSDNDVTPGEASDNIHEIITYLEDLNYRLDEYNMADDEDIQNGDFDDLLPMIDDTENLCKKLLTEETYSRMYNDIFKDLELVGNRDFELTNSRRPIKSGVENLDKIKEFEKRYAKIKGDIDKEEDLIQYYVGRYGIPEETLDEIAFNLRINSSFIRSTRYIATDPESGEVLGSADTYEEAVNEWGEDVTITDSEAAEGQGEDMGLFSSKKNLKEAKKLWADFENIPINENDEIEEDFLQFEAGTDRFEIWKWFENKFGVSIDEDLMYDITSSRKIASSRKTIKSSSIRKGDLSEEELNKLWELEKIETKKHYEEMDDLDKKICRDRYGIKDWKGYVHFFCPDPKKLSDDYKFWGDADIKLINKIRSSRKPIKSAKSEDKETVSVDVNSLYHFLTDSETAEVEGDFALVRCDEDDGETYYDILSDGDLACMDGETCEIVGRGEGFVELHSIEANDGVNFKLSPEEFEVACGKSKKQIKSSLTSDSFEMMIDESRKMAEDMNSNLDDWWVTKQVGQDVVYFVAEHKDYSVRVRFEFVDSGFCYVSKTYTNGSYYEPVALESWKYEGLSSQEIEGKMTAVLNDFFPKYNEIGSSKKLVESSVDYEPLTKLLDDLSAYPENRMPPAGIYKRLLDWKVGSEGMDEKEAREKFGTFTVGEWIDDLKESVM